jgi:hypothetical protein
MSDTVQSLLIFLLVLSPLYIPIAVTIVGTVAEWRETMRTRSPVTAATSNTAIADEPQTLPDTRPPSARVPMPALEALPTESDTEAA